MAAAGLVRVEPLVDEKGKQRLGEHGEWLVRYEPLYSVNALRHLAASLMIEDGLDAKTISRRMGHSSIKVTFDLYGHLFEKREADATSIARIEKNLLG
jgi:integrase